jgi:lipopolysaccharide/colanic/teichoic acid biosynthesis glycosyltransferase
LLYAKEGEGMATIAAEFPQEWSPPGPSELHRPAVAIAPKAGLATIEYWFEDVKVHKPYVHFVKPFLDRVLALIALIGCLPLIAVVAATVRLTMGKQVIFRQTRVGRNGKPITVYKFRTMQPDRRVASVPYEGSERRRTHKSPCNPRLTPVGRFLRKWSLDELPQLVNVLRGDMSMVGPRPELLDVVGGYEPWQHRRHQVKPGLTGLWQVNARGDGRIMHEHTRIDVTYIETLSFVTDLRILFLTIPAVLGRRTGY